MSKILFITRKENQNPAIDMKLQEMLDGQFTAADAVKNLRQVEENGIKLVVIFLSRLSSKEDIEVNKFLHNSGSIPVILAGERYELERYFEKTPANILRYIATPILLSEYVKEIKKFLNRIEGIKEEPEAPQQKEEIVEAAPKKILVVDDDVVMLRTISNWLTDLFIISVVKSGMAALEYLSRETPDLILLDYEMPVMDGIETLQKIREKKYLENVPVFFLTAIDNEEQVKKALMLKPQGYILKARGADHLISKIENYL